MDHIYNLYFWYKYDPFLSNVTGEQASVKSKRKDSAMDLQGEARIGKDIGGVPLHRVFF